MSLILAHGRPPRRRWPTARGRGVDTLAVPGLIAGPGQDPRLAAGRGLGQDPAVTEYQPAATIRAGQGMVCAVDHLASGAGLAMLRAGGTAADAAVAASAVLAVTSPHLCGMGGDLLAVVVPPRGDPVALNASGRAGSGADPDRLRAVGHTRMPFRGDIRSVTVPGCVDGWLALHGRFGTLPLADVLTPASWYAAAGFPASPTLAAAVAAVAHLPEAADLASAPLPGGDLAAPPGDRPRPRRHRRRRPRRVLPGRVRRGSAAPSVPASTTPPTWRPRWPTGSPRSASTRGAPGCGPCRPTRRGT